MRITGATEVEESYDARKKKEKKRKKKRLGLTIGHFPFLPLAR